MPSTPVSLIFEAIDRASQTIGNLNSKIQGLGVSSKAVDSAISGFFTGAGIAAFNTAINAVTSSFGFLNDKIAEGSSRQAALISSAGSLSVSIGKPIAEATDILRELNVELTKSVASLPGTTQSYLDLANSISNSLVPAAKDLSGNLDVDRLQQVTKEITEAYGVIGAGQGVQTKDITKALQGAIAGRSLSELRNLLLFQEGTGNKVFQEIQNQLVARNVSNLKDLDEAARIEALKIAGEKFATDEFKEALGQTFEGKLEGIKTVFDRLTDFSRVLSSRNNLSVIDAGTDILTSVFDLFEKLAQALGTGLGFTDETALSLAFDGLKSIAAFIDKIAASFSVEGLGGLFASASAKVTQIFEQFNSFIGGDNIASADAIFNSGVDIGAKIGQAIADWANTIDWGAVLVDLGQITIAVIGLAGGIIAGFSEKLIPVLIDILAQMAVVIDEGYNNLINYIGNSINGWVESVTASVTNFGQSVIDKVNEMWNALTTAVSSAIESAKQTIQNFDFVSFAKNIGSAAISSATNAVVNAATGGQGGSAKLEDASVGSSYYSRQNNYNASPNFNITVNGVGNDSGRLADELMNAIDQRWNQYKNNYFLA